MKRTTAPQSAIPDDAPTLAQAHLDRVKFPFTGTEPNCTDWQDEVRVRLGKQPIARN